MTAAGADPKATTTVLKGVGVGRRAVVGPVAQVAPAAGAPAHEEAPADIEQGAARVAAAFEAVAERLRADTERASGAARGVLEATAQMATDPALRSGVEGRVRAGEPLIAAVHAVVGQFADIFASAGGLLAERVTDLHSVRDRITADLLGLEPPGVPALAEPSVLVALDLAPADTALLDAGQVLAIVTELGGPTGHTSIIAGQLGIPCIVRVEGASAIEPGAVVAVDAAAGTVVVEPSPELVEQIAERAASESALASDEAPGATADGHAVQLLANIGTAADARAAAATACEGVGLFRTEVLFLERKTAPTTSEQAQTYREVLGALGGRKVVVRTLDAGADKPLAFATMPDEENPALGVRGNRLTRTLPDLVDGQLAALGETAGAGTRTDEADPLWVMAPMVATPAEAREFASRARAHGIGKVGVMVEIPAAALRAADILAEVDFVSLGTNDLAQYAMAADRLAGDLADLLDPFQPAVLDLVKATASAGRETGKPVGVCGESASDPLMAIVLTGLGVTSLSMSATAVPAVRHALRQHTMAECEQIAQAALAGASAAQARGNALALVQHAVRERLALT